MPRSSLTPRLPPSRGRRTLSLAGSIEPTVVSPQPQSACTFRDLYCEFYDVTPVRFEADFLRRALFPRARRLRWLAEQLAPNHFSADQQFVRRLAYARSMTDVAREIDDFLYHPSNREWWRRRFGLRISTRRVLEIAELLRPVLESATKVARAGTRNPFFAD